MLLRGTEEVLCSLKGRCGRIHESSLYSHTSTNEFEEWDRERERERENSAFEVHGRRNDRSTRLLFFPSCCLAVVMIRAALFFYLFITLVRAGALVWEFPFRGAVQKWPVLKRSSHIRLYHFELWLCHTTSRKFGTACYYKWPPLKKLLSWAISEEAKTCFMLWCFFKIQVWMPAKVVFFFCLVR